MMNWKEKVRFLIQKKAEEDIDRLDDPGVYYIDVLARKSCWVEYELESILKDYPHVPQSYIEFIKEFDHLGLLFVDFYGSLKGGLSLKKEIAEFYEYLQKDYFPFAKDPGGSVFAMAKDGSIVYFWDDDYEFEEPEKIADDFVDFIDNYVLGEKGCKERDPESYKYFKSLGWV